MRHGSNPVPVAFLVFACGKNQVAAHARIVHGPGFSGSVVARAASAAAPASGHWFISPDQGKVTLTALTFHDASGGAARVALSGCSPVYNRNDASLSTVLDCPFEVPSGTYVVVDIAVGQVPYFV